MEKAQEAKDGEILTQVGEPAETENAVGNFVRDDNNNVMLYMIHLDALGRHDFAYGHLVLSY